MPAAQIVPSAYTEPPTGISGRGCRMEEGRMEKMGILARMEAKPGKEDEVAAFLEGALPLVQEEPDTVTWYAIRIGPAEFGIFDTFEGDSGRQAHLSGKVAEALMAKSSELFVRPPDIQPIDVLASK